MLLIQAFLINVDKETVETVWFGVGSTLEEAVAKAQKDWAEQGVVKPPAEGEVAPRYHVQLLVMAQLPTIGNKGHVIVPTTTIPHDLKVLPPNG